MLFNSFEYLIFLPLVFLLYYIFPKKYRYLVLLMASFVFYMWWNVYYIFLLLGIMFISYLAGRFIKQSSKKSVQKIWLIMSLFCIVGLLGFFKYASFILNIGVGIGNLFHAHLNSITLPIILPVGISFYSFQAISYIVDVYEEKIKAEKNILYYSLYLSFFPQLVAGPIERSEKLIPQFKNPQSIQVKNLEKGLKYMLSGYLKKIVIADMLSIYVERIFSHYETNNALLVMIGSILFALQIFGDFSGYSDIAVGSAYLFNIELSENFDHPYSSLSVGEFFRKWHISLSIWLRDYIYFPLGGSRTSKLKWILNILIVFIVSGIWHGANWTFIIWGVMLAIFIIMEKLLFPFIQKLDEKCKIKRDSFGYKMWRRMITFLIICFCWISFRSTNLNEFKYNYLHLFTSWSFSSSYFAFISYTMGLKTLDYFIIAGCILIFPWIEFIKKDHPSSRTSSYIMRKGIYLLAMYLIIVCFLYLETNHIQSTFIYFQF